MSICFYMAPACDRQTDRQNGRTDGHVSRIVTEKTAEGRKDATVKCYSEALIVCGTLAVRRWLPQAVALYRLSSRLICRMINACGAVTEFLRIDRNHV